MRIVRRCVFLICFLSVLCGHAQTKKKPVQKKATTQTTQKKSSAQSTQKKPDATKNHPDPVPVATPDELDARVKEMIGFLGYLLNTLADHETPAQDKAVIVNESYSKIFLDGKVQIEDDLDASRVVITNKDVQAYLKDVDFFFSDAKFEFVIDNIQKEERPGNSFFYKVSLTRYLKGTNSDGVAVNNNQPRYVEINFDPKNQSLKIASIYTHQYSEKEALSAWWKQLSYEWQTVFRTKMQFQQDSLALAEIKAIVSSDQVSLRGNEFIRDLFPLMQLANLQVLDLSKTSIADISALRNLSELRELDLSDTKVRDLSPLKYASKIEKLILRNTEISDITVLQDMPKLRVLDLGHTRVVDITPLSGLTLLEQVNLSGTMSSDFSSLGSSALLTQLDISRTAASDLSSVSQLKNLKTLGFDSTQVSDLSPLSTLETLEIVHMNATRVASLDALKKLKKLQKVYCDRSLIKQSQAEALRAASPNVLVVFDSDDLSNWWNSLTDAWKAVIMKTLAIQSAPSKESLAVLDKTDSINLSGGADIRDLEPLSKFPRLKKVYAAGTSINDLTPLRNHSDLAYLDVSGTDVLSLSPVNQLTKLKTIRADRSKIANMEGTFPALENLYTDGTAVNDAIAKNFLQKNPKSLLVYKTEKLKAWWSNLPAGWRDIFKNQINLKVDATDEDLHRLVELEEIEAKDAPVSDFVPLGEFVRLSQLHLAGTAMTEVVVTPGIQSLTSLHLKGGPLIQTESLAQFTDLEDLDISNTPVEDIYPLWKLKKLKKLNCAGTRIKHLDALVKMEGLEFFDCSNTHVNKLDALNNLPLKNLKCFNTRLSSKVVERYRQAHPECSVQYY